MLPVLATFPGCSFVPLLSLSVPSDFQPFLRSLPHAEPLHVFVSSMSPSRGSGRSKQGSCRLQEEAILEHWVDGGHLEPSCTKAQSLLHHLAWERCLGPYGVARAVGGRAWACQTSASGRAAGSSVASREHVRRQQTASEPPEPSQQPSEWRLSRSLPASFPALLVCVTACKHRARAGLWELVC